MIRIMNYRVVRKIVRDELVSNFKIMFVFQFLKRNMSCECYFFLNRFYALNG